MTQTLSREQLTGDYDFDVSHSRLGFVVRHAMVTKIRGSFRSFSGELHIDGTDPTESWVRVTVEMASIDTGEPDRDAHLRSDDFFAVDRFPEMTFHSTSIRELGEDHYTMTGPLTIRDVTEEVTLDVGFTGAALDPFGNLRLGFEVAGTLRRADWGLSWNVPLDTGGLLVSDKIMLDIDISAIRKVDSSPR